MTRKKPMTDQEYLAEHGKKCPFCESVRLDGRDFESDGVSAWRQVTCLSCRRWWNDTFVMDGYEV